MKYLSYPFEYHPWLPQPVLVPKPALPVGSFPSNIPFCPTATRVKSGVAFFDLTLTEFAVPVTGNSIIFKLKIPLLQPNCFQGFPGAAFFTDLGPVVKLFAAVFAAKALRFWPGHRFRKW